MIQLKIFRQLKRLFFSGKYRPESYYCSPQEHFILDENFDMEQHPPCPRCKSEDVAIFVYGAPMMTRKILAGFESGRLLSGG